VWLYHLVVCAIIRNGKNGKAKRDVAKPNNDYLPMPPDDKVGYQKPITIEDEDARSLSTVVSL
jgi:hypothetical protein